MGKCQERFLCESVLFQASNYARPAVQEPPVTRLKASAQNTGKHRGNVSCNVMSGVLSSETTLCFCREGVCCKCCFCYSCPERNEGRENIIVKVHVHCQLKLLVGTRKTPCVAAFSFKKTFAVSHLLNHGPLPSS